MSAGFFTLSKETVAIEFEACVLQPAPNSQTLQTLQAPGRKRQGCALIANSR